MISVTIKRGGCEPITTRGRAGRESGREYPATLEAGISAGEAV
jgi:hypothetical protein